MKKHLFCLAIALLVPVSQAYASRVALDVGVNIGVPVAPVYSAPPVVIAAPPEFVAPPQLGFYVAVGVPYDLFYFSGRYYLSRGNIWCSSPYYNGPWVTVHYSKIPYGIRRLPFDRIHYYRDNYYRHYHKYGGDEYRHFRPHRDDWGRDGHGGGREDHGRDGGGHARGGGEGHGHRGR